MSVSDNDPRPPYTQVADDLRSLIERGDLTTGQRIPSGRDLAKKYGVALLTVQRAVDLLKGEGLLVSHAPRGIFVADPAAASVERKTHSPEYTAIMSHLESLQIALREHQDDVDRRLTALEKAAGLPERRSKSER